MRGPASTGQGEALVRLTTALHSCYEEALVSVVLYGSAAVDDFIPESSDVNVLILLREVTPEALRMAKRPLAQWAGEPALVPLFFSPAELAASTDVFPMEILDMRDRHRLLWGEDPFAKLTLSDSDLRRQLESELRGKWLRLRHAFLRDTGDAVALRALMRESVSSVQALLAAALRLYDDRRPVRRAEVFARAWTVFGLNAEVLERVVAVKEGRQGWPDAEMERAFERYLDGVERLLNRIDQKG